jgi:general transcription factor 3C polypeptide 5 (transcription factor C subunit 1)
MADLSGRERTAPFYPIPPRRIVSVEHPGVIKNVNRAIDTLDGNDGIARLLHPPKADTPANLFLRPEDAMSRPLQSISGPSNNVMLKVTVPKWTGRKRKRGSDEPFAYVDPTVETSGPKRPRAKTLQRTLRDNVGKYQIDPVGRVERTHVFRGIPDFVFSTTSSPFVTKFREYILPFEYEKMKMFDLDKSKGATRNVDLIPPPSFSHGDVPFHYVYRQNPTVKQSIDKSGQVTTVNTQQGTRVLTHLVPYDIPIVPSKPHRNSAPIPTLDKTLQETIATLEMLFTERPVWTRRGLRNSLKTVEQRHCLRHAVAYVGYIFRSGPWRDAIVKFGHDPRTSPDYRTYQTFMFHILPKELELSRDGGGGRRHTLPRPSEAVTESSGNPSNGGISTTHLFTGQPPLSLDGKMWMVCDITDPLLTSILFPTNPPSNFLRTTCDRVCDGWFGNGTLAKVKTIMRAKIQALATENRPTDDTDFVRLLSFPDHAAIDDNITEFMLDPEVASSRELQLAAELRCTIRGAPNWKGLVAAGMDQDGIMRPTTSDVEDGTRQPTARSEKRVRWDDEGDVDRYTGDESEGEEEAIEREEIAEAVAEAFAVQDQWKENDDAEEFENQGGSDDGEAEIEVLASADDDDDDDDGDDDGDGNDDDDDDD